MKKTMLKIALTAAVAGAILGPQFAAAESRWSVGTTNGLSAHADLKLKVVVPKIIILRVGDIGSKINEITWSAIGTTATDEVYNGSIPPTTTSVPFAVSDDETDADKEVDGAVKVQVFGNAGDVTLTSGATTDLSDGGSLSIPITYFSASDTGSLTHPGLVNGSTTLNNTNNIVNLSDTWTYTYNYNVANPPAAGEYTTIITYTATIP